MRLAWASRSARRRSKRFSGSMDLLLRPFTGRAADRVSTVARGIEEVTERSFEALLSRFGYLQSNCKHLSANTYHGGTETLRKATPLKHGGTEEAEAKNEENKNGRLKAKGKI